jgi:hypothetical protein
MAFAILPVVMIRVLLVALVLGCGTTPPPSSPNPPGGNPPGSTRTPNPNPNPTGAPAFFAFRDFSSFTAGANGALISPVVPTQAPFREAVASWNADTPSGSWIEIDLRARVGGTWTGDYIMGIWTSQNDLAHRHSVNGQTDTFGTVDTDTLRLNQAADAWQITIKPSGGAHVRLVSMITSDPTASPPALAPLPAAYGVAADVPQRSQMIYPNGGEVWCSPTSTSMLMAFWGTNETVPNAASACNDPSWGGTGNWPFNTAHAASAGGDAIEGFVTRLQRIEQLERLTAAGFPVAASIAFDRGELDGAPVSSTAGHLIVVRGFAANGDVMVNDPAGPNDSQVRYTYKRAQFDAAWAKSGRTIYVVHPISRPLPNEGTLGAW